MNADFTFPPRPKPIPRPQPVQQSPTEPVNRDSNALRASVLDAALALGLGTNDKVANWMFNNAVEEAEEDDEADSSQAPLSATSDEYGNYSYSTPATSTSSHSETQPAPLQVRFPVQPVTLISTPAPFPEPPSAPSGGNKLRKPRRADGYESDGGYVSDGGKKGRVRTKSKTAKDAPPSMPISEPMELVKLSKDEKKRRKKETKSSQDQGAETDAEDAVTSKSKSKPPKPKKKEKKSSTDAGGGYETDDGYVSSSKPKSGRSRFFSIRKKSGDNAAEAPAPEPVPELPKMPEFDLPIASRFATTFDGDAPSRSETPLLPPSRPFAASGIANSGSSASSLSSSSNSLLTPGDQDSFGPRSPTGLHDAGDNTLHADELNSSPSKANSSPTGKSRFAIFPLSRTGSANSLDPSANGSSKPGKHVPAPITTATLSAPNTALNSRAPSPSHLAGSPFVLLTPINSNSPPRAASPSPSAATDMIVPSSDFIVPSRSASPLPPPSPSSPPGPAPNVLAYYNYDVPPPSPPPSGPLPRAPPSSSGRAREAMREPLVGVARLRGMSQDRGGGRRSVSPNPPAAVGIRPVSPLPGGVGDTLSPVSPAGGGTTSRPVSPGGLTSPVSPGVQRGRAAPFPMAPVLGNRQPGVGVGLAARAKVQRYADLYAIQLPPSPERERRRARFAEEEGDDEVDIRVEDWDEDDGLRGEPYAEEDEGEEMQQVLGRFRDANAQREEKGRRMAIALERNNSGALRPGTGRPIRSSSPTPQAAEDARYPEYLDDDQASQYPDEDRTAGRSTMYRVENGGSDTMRWSGYTDTRASFLDLEKSEKARGALVDRVGVMFDLSGRERPAVPPVPKLPAGLMASGNRF